MFFLGDLWDAIWGLFGVYRVSFRVSLGFCLHVFLGFHLMCHLGFNLGFSKVYFSVSLGYL